MFNYIQRQIKVTYSDEEDKKVAKIDLSDLNFKGAVFINISISRNILYNYRALGSDHERNKKIKDRLTMLTKVFRLSNIRRNSDGSQDVYFEPTGFLPE